MERRFLGASLFLILLLCFPGFVTGVSAHQGAPPSPTPASAVIYTPVSGQALQGKVPIEGFSALEGFLSAEISFTYAQEAEETWFSILRSKDPVPGGLLAEWDTTTISDGLYTLRMVIHLADGTSQTVLVENLRVRNYTPVETSTPSPSPGVTVTQTGPTATPTSRPTLTPLPQISTPLPPNPAEITPEEIRLNLSKGALAAGGMFALIGLYQKVLSMRSRRKG
ncbi:MAG: hypothetical protein GX495_03955 [Chloroflexi bacterium]|nr:hypothetical protein [Chloroflexota bacterium]